MPEKTPDTPKIPEPPKMTSPLEVIADLKAKGFTKNFQFTSPLMQCVETHHTYQAQELSVQKSYRFEGASDPDDMSIILALEARDGTLGIFVDAFGVNADIEAGEFYKQIPDKRDPAEGTHNTL